MFNFDYLVKDTCQLPADIGNCQNYSALWYFDTKIKRCRQFYYGGCGGNENRFNSESECDQRCRKPEEEQPKAEPTRPPTEPPRTHPPRTTQAPVTRPSVERQKDHCLLPYESGRCEERHRRYYYDRSYGICTQFLYTGCDGNENNFETLEECEELCSDAVDLCDLSPLAGRCDENVTKWYFDSYSQSCHQFDYTGCDGNPNNFDDERSCLYACQHKRGEQSQPHEEHHTQPPARVTPPPENVLNFLIL